MTGDEFLEFVDVVRRSYSHDFPEFGAIVSQSYEFPEFVDGFNGLQQCVSGILSDWSFLELLMYDF